MNLDLMNMHIPKEDKKCGEGYCSNCGHAKYVGWYQNIWLCLGCMDEYDEEQEFVSCSNCDGHDACYDFGCAIDLGIGIETDYV